jgi:hypothetical protein
MGLAITWEGAMPRTTLTLFLHQRAAVRRRERTVPLEAWQADDLALGLTVPPPGYRLDDERGVLVRGRQCGIYELKVLNVAELPQ